MMNRNRITDEFSTINTIATIPINRLFTCIKPASSTISCDSTDPKGRVFPRLKFRHKFGVALFRTKAFARDRFILPLKPGLNLKLLTTISTFIYVALYSVNLFCLLASKGICWAFTFSELVSYQMFVWHFSILHMPFSTTLIATKPGGFSPIGFYLKFFTTYFASFCYHALIVPHSMNYGTIDIAVKRIKDAQQQMRLPL